MDCERFLNGWFVSRKEENGKQGLLLALFGLPTELQPAAAKTSGESGSGASCLDERMQQSRDGMSLSTLPNSLFLSLDQPKQSNY